MGTWRSEQGPLDKPDPTNPTVPTNPTLQTRPYKTHFLRSEQRQMPPRSPAANSNVPRKPCSEVEMTWGPDDGTVFEKPDHPPKEAVLLAAGDFPDDTGPMKGWPMQAGVTNFANGSIISQTGGKLQTFKDRRTNKISKRGRDGRGGYDKRFDRNTHVNCWMGNPHHHKHGMYKKLLEDPDWPIYLISRAREGKPFAVFKIKKHGPVGWSTFEGKEAPIVHFKLVNADESYPSRYPDLYGN